MMYRTLFPLWARLAILLAIIYGPSGILDAQEPKGFTLQERPGIAFVKPQAWSKPNEATITEFQAFIDRTAAGGGRAGYFELLNKQGQRRQIPASRIVKIVVYPNPDDIRDITGPKDRQSLVTAMDDLKATMAKFPASRSYLESPLKKLAAEVAQFDAGKIKRDGKWVLKQAYLKEQALKWIDLLKAEIARATPPGSLNLELDPKYIALLEVSATDPKIKALTAELAATHAKRVRTEKRKALLVRLKNPALGISEAENLVAQIKTLQPNEAPKAAAAVKRWDAGIAAMKNNAAMAAKLAVLLDAEMAAVTDPNVPPQLSKELQPQIATLQQNVAIFIASNPPEQLIKASEQAIAVGAVAEGFSKLQTIFADKQFLAGKNTLDALSRHATSIGPHTAQVIAGLHQFAATQIDQFTRLREEARILAESGKTKDALVKYEAAFKVIPEAGVGEEIARLKAAAPAPPK